MLRARTVLRARPPPPPEAAANTWCSRAAPPLPCPMPLPRRGPHPRAEEHLRPDVPAGVLAEQQLLRQPLQGQGRAGNGCLLWGVPLRARWASHALLLAPAAGGALRSTWAGDLCMRRASSPHRLQPSHCALNRTCFGAGCLACRAAVRRSNAAGDSAAGARQTVSSSWRLRFGGHLPRRVGPRLRQ